LCLDLLNYLNANDQQGLEEYLRTLQLPGPTSTEEDPIPPEALPAREENWPGGAYGWRGEIHTWNWRAKSWLDAGPEALAKMIVAQLVNENTERLGSEKLAVVDGRFKDGYSLAALIEIVYWHVYRLVKGLESLGRCEECGEYFPKFHAKQHFCPGQDGKESACAARARQRRARAKARTGS
jgi:hypothetical protein